MRLYCAEEDTWFHYELDDQERAVRQVDLRGPDRRPVTAAALDEVLRLHEHHGLADLQHYERRFGILAKGSLKGRPDADQATEITRQEFEALWTKARRHLAELNQCVDAVTSVALMHALNDSAELPLVPLPDHVVELLQSLDCPPRLAAHLRLVHDVAWQLVDWVERRHPDLEFDRQAALFGAATHDIGKAVHVAELSGPGSTHEPAGRDLLLQHGFGDTLARFAATHASWTDADATFEDLLVSLADKIWKNKRLPELEDLVVAHLAQASGRSPWEEFAALDELLARIGDAADQRLTFQASYPLHG